jgi:hypothetical protein
MLRVKRILIVSAIFAIAFRAYPSTMSSFSISTSVPGGTPCFLSGTDQDFGTCMSSSPSGAEAGGSVTLTDNSLEMAAYSDPHGNTFESASVTHDDFYSVPVNGPVSALLSLICGSSGVGLGFTGNFFLGSTNVSPPVKSIFLGASQGGGACSGRNEFAPEPPALVVSLFATNNIVELDTNIEGTGGSGDGNFGLFIQLAVDGFEDANGNPIVATLLAPEPATWTMLLLAFLMGVGMKAEQKLSALVNTTVANWNREVHER